MDLSAPQLARRPPPGLHDTHHTLSTWPVWCRTLHRSHEARNTHLLESPPAPASPLCSLEREVSEVKHYVRLRVSQFLVADGARSVEKLGFDEESGSPVFRFIGEMDDPLVGITIWQSAQLHKKTRARQELLKQALGVDDCAAAANGVLSNGWAGVGGGRGGRERVSRGSGSREERARGRRGSRQRDADGGSDCRSTVSPEDVAVLENGVAGEDYEEEEEELTERSLLYHEEEEEGKARDHTQTPGDGGGGSPVTVPQNFWLMRLFESEFFDMSIAIGYFLRSKEPEVQAYLGNKLFVSLCTVRSLHACFLLKFSEH